MQPISFSLQPLAVAGYLATGILLGSFYFGGLWLTTRQLPWTRRPALLFLASFVGRTLITIALLYTITGGAWPALLLNLIGFLLTRFVLTRRFGPGQPAKG